MINHEMLRGRKTTSEVKFVQRPQAGKDFSILKEQKEGMVTEIY